MKRRSKRKTGETDTSVLSIEENTGEIITTKIKNGKRTVVHIVDEKGIEVMPAYSAGTGVDIHRSFGQVTVLVRNNGKVFKYGTAFQTDTESILAAKKWCHEIIQNNSSPRVDVTDENFRYAIESTGNYMTPITLLWGGKPSIINPNIAKAGMVKSDILDSYTLAVHNLTGTWPQSFVISTDVQTLRVLIAERDNCNKLATRCSNRIVNLLLKFGYTIARDGSIVKKKELREFVEDQLSDTPQIKPLSDKIRIPDDAKCIFHDLYNDYDELKRRVAEYDKRIQKKIKSMEWDTEHGKVDGKRMLEVLTSAPGVGLQTAAIWLAYVVTPMRFATVNKCAAYCGFDPSNKVSAGKVRNCKNSITQF